MIKKTEEEIKKSWRTEKMMVSITCVAFNHEDYINTTLNSFLEQETNFPFEILINDDVSTDRTVEIIKEYEKQFPNIVKAVYQTENQYSQGINTMAILFPFVTGKYVAFCDGDDYWIDKQKLQIQVEEMEKHPEVDLSFHPSYRLEDGEHTEILAKQANANQIFGIEKSILGHGDFAETASMVFTSRLISSLPEWFKTAMPGDYVSEVIGAERGGSLYIDKIMSVYRSGIDEGWTIQELKKSTEERKESLKNINDQLTFLDNYLGKKYTEAFNQAKLEGVWDFVSSVNNSHAVKKVLYNEHRSSFSFKEKILWSFLYKNQKLIEKLKLLKNTMKPQ